MGEISVELTALSSHLRSRREAILKTWRAATKNDPTLTTGDALPRAELYDHLPALLATFERQLCDAQAPADKFIADRSAAQEYAAAHGLQRWKQGYDLREVTRELGKLNETVVAELDDYTAASPQISPAAVATARRAWAALCSTGIEESVGQYFQLQQQEAAGHVDDLERALLEIRALEQSRADLWHQAAHDLRGNLGVVANATVGLTHTNLKETSRDSFVRILMRNVTSLHHLLDDVTSLARLQAGREVRSIEPIDVSPIMQQLCEGVRPLAQQRHLFLRCDGPDGYAADGDAVKIRRIAQNLILNAVKFTRDGGITVNWGDSDVHDTKRWQLRISDSGPGIPTTASATLAQTLDSRETGNEFANAPANTSANGSVQEAALESASDASGPSEASGEGLGLSIVKRLCDMLDATVEMTSEANVGTTFTIRFPRRYAASSAE